jgi:type IV secretory pathway TrbD component
VTAERLILIGGIACAVAFLATWEPLFGVLAFILLVALAPWLAITDKH